MRAKAASTPEETEILNQQAQESNDTAVCALYEEARAYQTLGNSEEAIKQFARVVEEFPEHKLAPQAQFQIGNIYFYDLYDYSNSGGWGAFVKVIEKFPDAYEASDAETLLKKSAAILTEIKQAQEDIQKYTKKELSLRARRKVLSGGILVAGYADRIAQDFQIIGAGWVQMRNYPFCNCRLPQTGGKPVIQKVPCCRCAVPNRRPVSKRRAVSACNYCLSGYARKSI